MDKKSEEKKDTLNEQNKNKEDPKDQKIQEITNDLKRVQADFSNYCKRTEKDKQEFIEYASASFICKLFPIIDELEISLNRITNENDKKGIQLIFDKLKKLLKQEGVTEIKCKGQKFDPFRHEAMQFDEGKEEGIVLEELQKGYEMKGKIIRYAKVKVSKGLSDNKLESAQNKILQDSKQSLEGEKNENNRN